MTRSRLSLVIAALLLQAPAASAAQLDKDSCAKLKTEQVQLEQSGTRASLSKGPEWAKANLAPEKLELVRRLIEVDEQLLFRCGGRPLVVLPSDPDPAAREVESKGGAGAAPAKATKTPDAVRKAPDADKKKAVPLKKAAAPAADPPAYAAPKEPPPTNTLPPPEATPPAPPAPAREAAKEASPTAPAPQPQAAPASAPAPAAKEAESKKAAAIKAAKAKAKKRADDAYRPPTSDWGANPFAGMFAPASPPPAKK